MWFNGITYILSHVYAEPFIFEEYYPAVWESSAVDGLRTHKYQNG